MLDKNIVILEGIIGDDYKTDRTQVGKEFITFSLCVNSFMKEIADDTERTNSQVYVRIFVYDKRVIQYLKNVNAKRGQRANVFGRLGSFKNEYRGITFMSNSIICRDITVIKTKKEDNENENKE